MGHSPLGRVGPHTDVSIAAAAPADKRGGAGALVWFRSALPLTLSEFAPSPADPERNPLEDPSPPRVRDPAGGVLDTAGAVPDEPAELHRPLHPGGGAGAHQGLAPTGGARGRLAGRHRPRPV